MVDTPPPQAQQDHPEAQALLSAVRVVHERLVPVLQALFVGGLKRDVDVAIAEIRSLPFGLYVQSLDQVCWNYCFKIDSMGGGHLGFSLPLCIALMDPEATGEEIQHRMARVLAESSDGRWASDSQYHVIALMVKQMAEALEAAWCVVQERGLRDIDLQTLSSSIYPHRPREQAIHVTFDVRAEGCQGLTLSLCYMVSTIRAIAEALDLTGKP